VGLFWTFGRHPCPFILLTCELPFFLCGFVPLSCKRSYYGCLISIKMYTGVVSLLCTVFLLLFFTTEYIPFSWNGSCVPP
jgi:hypothetical protein